jgi:hypothetical protein
VESWGWEQAKTIPEVRILLQRFGTEAGRELHGEDVWISKTLDNLPDGSKVVIPDVRYPNEADAIRASGGTVVRIERPGYASVNSHISESAMDDYSFDGVILNDKDVESLREEAAKYVGYVCVT